MSNRLEEVESLGKRFAVALVEGRPNEAHEMLTDALKLVYSPKWLIDRYTQMIHYGDGPPAYIGTNGANSMEGWAVYKEGDLGHVYLVISGDGFSEAVALIFEEENGLPRVRDIEWGRP